MIPKDYSIKISDILSVFTQRINLLEKLSLIEINLKRCTQFDNMNGNTNNESDEEASSPIKEPNTLPVTNERT